MLIRRVVAASVVTLIALVGCGARTESRDKPEQEVMVKGEAVNWGRGTTQVSELCYQGVVYLINAQGGMTVKMRPEVAGGRAYPTLCESEAK